jgi:antitoxin ChpS
MAEIKAAARSKRYSRADLLKGADAMKQLSADVAWARDGAPVGDEIT